MCLTLDGAIYNIYIDDQREGNDLASNQCMSRSQTLNICSNREVCEGQEQKTDQAIFFSIRTVKQSTSSWSPPLPYKLTQPLCSLCIPKVQLSEQTLCLQAICTSAKTHVPLSLWPERNGSSLNGNKLYHKDVKLGMSETRLSVMLALVYLSFLFCSSCQTWVLMSWESLGLIVSTKHTAEIIQPEALLISTNFSNEVPTVTHKISLEKLDP